MLRQKTKTAPCHSICAFFFLFFILGSLLLTTESVRAENKGVQPHAANIEKLDLQSAITLALEQNRTLKRSLLNLKSNSLTVNTLESAFDVQIRPAATVGYSSSVDENWRTGFSVSKKTPQGIVATVIPEVSNDEDKINTSFGLSLNIPLLRGLGKEFAQDEVLTGKYNFKRAELDFYRQQDSVVLQVITAIYQSLQYQQNLDLINKQLQGLENHLALAKLKEKAGVISAIDLYRAQIRIKDVQDELAITNETYLNSLDQIKEIMAVPITGNIIVSAPIDLPPFTLQEEEVIDIALSHRIELDEKQLELDEAKRKMTISKNSLLPQFDLEVGYNRFGDQVLFDLPEESWTISLTSDTDLFRTSEKNQYEESKIRYRRNQIDFEETKDQIVKEVRTELNRLQKQQHQISIRKEQVTQARGKLRLSESKFRHGMAGNFDLLDSQTQLQQAQTNLLNDTISYIIGTYSLRSKIGTLTERGQNKVTTQ